MLYSLPALAISIAAVALIHYNWRQPGKAWTALAGWLLAFASALAWSAALGPEFGISFAIIIFVCLVWGQIAVVMPPFKAAGQNSLRPFQEMRWPDGRSCFKHSLLFLLSVPATGLIAMMLSVALVLYLPWTLLSRVAVAIFLYPVLWGAMSAWICAQDKLLKPVLASLALFAICGLLLFIGI